MPITSPDSIYFADGTTPASLSNITAAMATSVQNALNVRETKSYIWPDEAARDAQTGMANGETGYQTDNETYYIYSGSWLIWAKAPATYTPTFTGFSATSNNFIFSISGGVVSISGNAILSGAVSGEMTISLPGGYSVDSTLLPTSQGVLIGVGGVDDASGTTNFPLGVRVSNSSLVALVAYNAASTYLTIVPTAAGVPLAWANNDVFNVNFSYPVA
jgi:hypothetical protein